MKKNWEQIKTTQNDRNGVVIGVVSTCDRLQSAQTIIMDQTGKFPQNELKTELTNDKLADVF